MCLLASSLRAVLVGSAWIGSVVLELEGHRLAHFQRRGLVVETDEEDADEGGVLHVE